jgi:uncharacterized SAM-dependent methyltransferase
LNLEDGKLGRASGRSAFAFLTVHRSQWPAALRTELLASLAARTVNPKFHYDTPKQVRRWLALHEAVSPARRDPGVQAMYREAFQAAVREVGAGSVHLIGLGCGGGQKETQFIEVLVEAGISPHYSPTDVSVGMVLVAREHAQPHLPAEAMSPLVADLTTADDLHEFFDRHTPTGAARCFTCFGLVPNFTPELVRARLDRLLRPGDWLLLSANLAPGADYSRGVERILPQYDNALTRDWLLTFLLDLGVERSDGQLCFAIVEPPAEAGLRRVQADFTFARLRELAVEGERWTFAPGDCLRVFFSYRYTLERLREMLRPVGLRERGHWMAASGEEGVMLLRRE